ncbi:polygalacturonase [Tripterygium wilfordii]|uniref:Polygalacturonase n=1 Tax=Tripterygium wilfordii TaxID=458696 RepID=A0A7J7DBU7_TRIWF|nr:polygalacturonase [Tripterygium wilfordii]
MLWSLTRSHLLLSDSQEIGLHFILSVHTESSGIENKTMKFSELGSVVFCLYFVCFFPSTQARWHYHKQKHTDHHHHHQLSGISESPSLPPEPATVNASEEAPSRPPEYDIPSPSKTAVPPSEHPSLPPEPAIPAEIPPLPPPDYATPSSKPPSFHPEPAVPSLPHPSLPPKPATTAVKPPSPSPEPANPPENIAYNSSTGVFDVRKFGAIGDGETDDTNAFKMAWDSACQVDSAVLHVPYGFSFMIQSTIFTGPCQDGLVFQVDGTVMPPDGPDNWPKNTSRRQWLIFYRVDNMSLQGGGLINGRGEKWWDLPCKPHKGTRGTTFPGPCDSPIAIRFFMSSNLTVQGLRIEDSPQFHFRFDNCRNVHIESLHITAPALSPNTDGIHIENTNDVRIYNSIVSNVYSSLKGTYDIRSPPMHFACSDSVPCTNLTLSDIELLPAKGDIVLDPSSSEKTEHFEFRNILSDHGMESERVQDRSDLNVEDEMDDDEKMEKFFSLIRSFQEARNRRRNELKRESETKNSQAPGDDEKKKQVVDRDDDGLDLKLTL